MNARFEATERWLKEEGVARGEVLRSVEYVLPSSLERELLQVTLYEEAPMGVELSFVSGKRLGITWHMGGKCHGLVMGSDSVETLRDFNVSLSKREPASEHWERRVGRELSSMKPRWHVSDGGCPPTVWALELSFGPLSTLIGLGELSPKGPTYMPDELVVGFGLEARIAFRNAAEIQVQ